MTLARFLLRSLQLLVPPSPRGTLVLAYHLVGAGTRSPVDVPLEIFETQMAWLAENARVFPLRELPQLLQSPAPGLQVCLTFDDGFANFAEKVLPTLERHRLPATLFVPVGFLRGEYPGPLRGAEHLAPLSAQALREVVGSGLVDVGSHSWSHRDLRRLNAHELHRELGDSRAFLEDLLAREVSCFCFPRALWSPAVVAQVEKVYNLGVVGGGQRVSPRRWVRGRIPRRPIRSPWVQNHRQLFLAPIWLEEQVADLWRRL